ncbi:MAG: hypothetical protein ACTSO7_06995 [Candidatus Heimdallarchaeota archaeon]
MTITIHGTLQNGEKFTKEIDLDRNNFDSVDISPLRACKNLRGVTLKRILLLGMIQSLTIRNFLNIFAGDS